MIFHDEKRRWFLMALVLMFSLGVPVLAGADDPFPIKYEKSRALLVDKVGREIGTAEYWNTRDEFIVDLHFDEDGWVLKDAQIYLGPADTVPPTMRNGKPDFSEFTYQQEFDPFDYSTMIRCSLPESNFRWGARRERLVSIHMDLVRLKVKNRPMGEPDRLPMNRYYNGYNDAWALPLYVHEDGYEELDEYFLWPRSKDGGYFAYKFTHPRRGHFIDSPVEGLAYKTPTNQGRTDEGGGFDYFPGERVELKIGGVSLGSALADHKISPLDIFENSDTTDIYPEIYYPEVINMARLLQSLDADADPSRGITITPETASCLEQAVGMTELDFYNDGQIDNVIDDTIACSPDYLVEVSALDAKENLDKSLDSAMFRKNISRTPLLSSSKSKLEIMMRWFPAFRANGEPTVVEYYDQDGALIRTAEEAKPVVVVYTDAVEETELEDIFVAVSRDDGNTFKRKNIARGADKSSFTLANGLPYYGEAKKPVVQVRGNRILAAWTSKYCNGGKPRYAIDLEDDYSYDDPYYTEDIWGVAGPQRSHDYTEDGFPEVGEVPYSCVWTARGLIATEDDISKGLGEYVGDIVWFKPERLTSGRRDANQVFAGGAEGAGFAIAWQEDPDGLRPGQAKGPGPGWGGATTNHKTDIWYSFITWNDFAIADTNFIPGGDPVHEDPDVVGRPKALVPMSLPVRVTDNDVVNSENILATTNDFATWDTITNPNTEGDGDGTHAYGWMIDGLCEGWYEKVNEQGELKEVCITADGRLLDGDTGASRPNLFLQKYTKADGSVSAWAIFAYDESKGLGSGPPEEPGVPNEGEADYLPEEGKNSLYHSFDFQHPDLVSAGTLINLPQKEYTVDENYGVTVTSNITYLVDEAGNQILEPQPVLDADGEFTGEIAPQPHINYENARRPRFIIQGKSGMGASRTIMMILYKEGEEGSGRPSDIMLRRVVVPAGQTGNPYRPENILCNAWETAENGQTVCVDGAQNVSTVMPTVTTESQGDPTAEDPYGAIKVVEWVQTPETLAWPSGVNRYEDARAHRGGIMGDFVVMGYSQTPNWAAYRNGNDKYDFFMRRSFDGGQTWTTDPNGSGVTNCDTFTDPTQEDPEGGHLKYEVCTFYPAGEFEQARNLSQLPNSKSSVIEPRIVKAQGTIKNPDGTATGYPEDINTFGMYYTSYGTATNPKEEKIWDETTEKWINVTEEAAPMDLYYSFSLDLGETHVDVAWDVNPDSDGNFAGETIYRWDYLAKGNPEQGEAQLRITPDGSRFYATWVQEGEDNQGDYGSDIWLRRIMSPEFPANVAAPTP